MTGPTRSPTDQQNDIRNVGRFVTALEVFATHGRTNGLDPDACDALLMLVKLLHDPVGRLLQDHGAEARS